MEIPVYPNFTAAEISSEHQSGPDWQGRVGFLGGLGAKPPAGSLGGALGRVDGWGTAPMCAKIFCKWLNFHAKQLEL